jgi:hypothetical protein
MPQEMRSRPEFKTGLDPEEVAKEKKHGRESKSFKGFKA